MKSHIQYDYQRLPRRGKQQCRIICQAPHPDPKTRPTTSNEAFPTAWTILEVSLPHHSRKLGSCQRNPTIEQRTLAVQIACICDEGHRRSGQSGEYRTGPLSEQQGGGADAHVHVVFLILKEGIFELVTSQNIRQTHLMGVDSVIDQCPADATCIQGQTDTPVCDPRDSRPS